MIKKVKNKKNLIFLYKLGYCSYYLKYLLHNFFSNRIFYFFLRLKLDKIFFRFNRSKLKYICVTSFRSFSNFNYFKMSRVMIKSLASFGDIAGLKKSS